MAVTVLKLAEAPSRRPALAPAGRPAGAETADDFLMQATRAREVFADRAAFHDWFACVLHHRAYGAPKRGRAECDDTSALACALSFRGECAFATAGRQLDAVMRGLPTDHLEALLRVCGERRVA